MLENDVRNPFEWLRRARSDFAIAKSLIWTICVFTLSRQLKKRSRVFLWRMVQFFRGAILLDYCLN